MNVKILFLSSSKTFQLFFEKCSKDISLNADIIYIESMTEFLQFTPEELAAFDISVCDNSLPGCSKDEHYQHLERHKVPTIIASSDYYQDVHQKIYSNSIINYFLKDSPQTVSLIADEIKRWIGNKNRTIWICARKSLEVLAVHNSLKHQNFSIRFFDSASKLLKEFKDNTKNLLILLGESSNDQAGLKTLIKLKAQNVFFEYSFAGISYKASHMKWGAPIFTRYGGEDFIDNIIQFEDHLHRISRLFENLELIDYLKLLATRDPLTSLGNRRFFDEQLSTIQGAEDYLKNSKYILMFDIDFFKKVNDTYGHDTGDKVLVQFSKILENWCEPQEVLARIGGEEFCILLLETHTDQRRTSEPTEIHQRINELLQIIRSTQIQATSKDSIQITASGGLVKLKDQSIPEAIKEADNLLYQAKESGRNQVFSSTQTQAIK